MKTNKTIVGFSIVLALACVFQLSFTWKAQGFEKEAKAFAAKVADKGGDSKEAIAVTSTASVMKKFTAWAWRATLISNVSSAK